MTECVTRFAPGQLYFRFWSKQFPSKIVWLQNCWKMFPGFWNADEIAIKT